MRLGAVLGDHFGHRTAQSSKNIESKWTIDQDLLAGWQTRPALEIGFWCLKEWWQIRFVNLEEGLSRHEAFWI